MFEYKAGWTPKAVQLAKETSVAHKVAFHLSEGGTEKTHYFVDPAGDAETFVKDKLAQKDYLGAGKTLVAACRIAGDPIKPYMKERLAYEAIKAHLAKKGEELPEWVEEPELK